LHLKLTTQKRGDLPAEKYFFQIFDGSSFDENAGLIAGRNQHAANRSAAGHAAGAVS
jgi:hypothetical protein